MEVYALVGRSGTGKSHRAVTVANKIGVSTVIDDGLLIKDGRKLAGKSAKRETTTYGAVKRAIFYDPVHAQEIKACLAELQPAKILILGTSIHMIERITTVLDLPQPVQIIKIEEIATEREIELARKLRVSHGMHVIPVPTIELKSDFSGYLVDPLKYFIKKKNEPRLRLDEKSIVRPKFSLIGKLVISEYAISQIVTHILLHTSGIAKVNRVVVNLQEEGVTIWLEITANYNVFLPDVAKKARKSIQQQIEYFTGLLVNGVHITFKSLDY